MVVGVVLGSYRDNIQQISYIPQTEQHSPFRLMLLRLGNVTYFPCLITVGTKVPSKAYQYIDHFQHTYTTFNTDLVLVVNSSCAVVSHK